MWQRFTERARKVIFSSQEEAQKYGHQYVGPDHILLGLLRDKDSVAWVTLVALQGDPDAVKAEVIERLEKDDTIPPKDMTLTPAGKRVIDLAYDEARSLNNNYIGTEHLLLGLIAEERSNAAIVLNEHKVDQAKAREIVREIQAKAPKPEAPKTVPPAVKRSGQPHVPYSYLTGRHIVTHLVLAATSAPESLAGQAIRQIVPDFPALQAALWATIAAEHNKGVLPADGSELTALLHLAQEEANRAAQVRVNPCDILIAAARTEGTVVATTLKLSGATPEKLRETIAVLTSNGGE